MKEVLSKEQISRDSIRDIWMKQVIIRLDYAGVADLNELIKIFDLRINKFAKRQEMYVNQLGFNIRAEDLKNISDTLSIPIEAIKKEKIWRYSELNVGQCSTTLDISQYFMCMTIDCQNNYDGITEYVKVFKEVMEMFTSNIKYFEPKRIGLRKARVQKLKTLDEVANIFEPYIYCMDIAHINSALTHDKFYRDIVKKVDDSLYININRIIKSIDDETAFNTTLDLDAYTTNLDKKELSNIIDVANAYEFEVYKSCMTLNYLNTIIK